MTPADPGPTPTTPPEHPGEPQTPDAHPVERLVSFTDAVVAIALTLLILPLVDGAAAAARSELTTADYLQDYSLQLFSFVLSFVLIAGFWDGHHRLYRHISRYNSQLLWLNGAWMLSIVWFPVATALVGEGEPDPLQEVLYIGTMLVSSLLLGGSARVVRRHPELCSAKGPPTASFLSANLAVTILYAVALLLALTVPGLGYRSLFLLFLTPVVQRLVQRRVR